jgi:hypothetical protein
MTRQGMRRYRAAVTFAVLYVLLAAIGNHLPRGWPPGWAILARLAVFFGLWACFRLYAGWMSHRPGGATLTERRLFLAGAIDLLGAAVHPRPADGLRAGLIHQAIQEVHRDPPPPVI